MGLAVVLAGCGTSSTQPSGAERFVQASAGYAHACALTGGGSVLCWGDDRWGQVSGQPGSLVFAPVTAIPLPVRAVAVSAGALTSCAVAATGETLCWGDSLSGLWRIAGSGELSEVHAGAPTCGLTSDGSVRCWPKLDGPSVSVVGGPYHGLGVGRLQSCALQADSTAVCWPSDLTTPPSPVPGGIHFAVISVGGEHVCGVDGTGSALCWGANEFGQLGDDSTTPRATPGAMHVPSGATGDTIIRVFAGDQHSCGLGLDSLAYCWGRREGGRDGLGDPDTGSVAYNFVPFAVHSSIKWDSLLLGGLMSCGYAANVLYCWGGNTYGSDGALHGVPNAVPVPVDGQEIP